MIKNSELNNKLYPEKRAIIAEWEKATEETQFVPICTRNVFFKHYSPLSTTSLLWDKKAGKEYVKTLTEVVAKYIGVNYFTEKLEDIVEKDGEIEYGFIKEVNNGR